MGKRHHAPTPGVLWNGGVVWTCREFGQAAQIVRRRFHEVTPQGDDLIGALLGVGGTTEHEFRFDRVQLELKACNYAKIAAAAAQRPKQIGMLGLTGMNQSAFRSYDVRRHQIVNAEAVAATQPTDAASEREARNTSR
jgi:hypothetical protein